ncbi:hypothetical protein D3C76_51970 [compost metagenome]
MTEGSVYELTVGEWIRSTFTVTMDDIDLLFPIGSAEGIGGVMTIPIEIFENVFQENITDGLDKELHYIDIVQAMYDHDQEYTLGYGIYFQTFLIDSVATESLKVINSE